MPDHLPFGPDFVDPIPEPELVPVPPAWSQRPAEIQKHMRAFSSVVELSRGVIPPVSENRRGVLLCGGGKYWAGMVLAVRMLRDAGSDLPVELWHRGEDEPVDLADLQGLGDVRVMDAKALGVQKGARILRGWETKLFAIVHSRFETLLYLDADAYPVANPLPLLELAEKEGFIFWEDLASTKNNVKWPMVWPAGANGIGPIQGGQLAIHRPMVWREIALAHWLNQHSDYFYKHMFGDQDTWRVAFAATGRAPCNLGPAPWQETAFVCPFAGAPLIVHRCQGKLFRPEDIPTGNTAYANPKYGLPREAAVFDHFAAILKKYRDPERVFGAVYAKKIWGNGSGAGSSEGEAKPYIETINALASFAGVESIVDLGSGDGLVGSRLKAPRYLGLEVHPPMVELCKRTYPGRAWEVLDFYHFRERIPSGDLLLCKDVFHHWPNEWVENFLAWVIQEKRWKRFVFTQDRSQVHSGQDCHLGGYRALSASMEPLSKFAVCKIADYLHKSVLMVHLC